MLVVFEHVSKNEDMVCVKMDKDAYDILEYQVHNPLKGCRAIAVPLDHNVAHKHPKDIYKHRFPDIWRFIAYLFICIAHVELRPIFVSSHVCTDVVLVWERSYIFDCIGISLTVVNNSAQRTILFWYTKHGSCLARIVINPPLGSCVPT